MNPTPPVPTLPQASDQYAQLKSAVLGAQQAGGASPLGNFPELQGLQNATAPLEIKNQQTAGNVYNNAVTVANQKAAESAARANQNAMLDGSKYTRVPAGDGGWNFIAPNGQRISADAYSKITGQSLDKVLANSNNLIDKGFIEDYNNLQDFLKAVQNKNTAVVEATIKDNPELDKYRHDLLGLTQRFKDHYPTVYGGNKNGNQPVDSTYIPNQAVANANNPNYGGSVGDPNSGY